MRGVVLVLAGGLAAVGAGADDPSGRITGSVTCRDGAQLPGVSLVITSATGAQTVRLSTGSLGRFRSPELAPGTYELRASLAAFEDKVVPVVVRAGEETSLDVSLGLASFRETVSVVGEAPRGTLEASELREGPALDVGETPGWKAGLWRLRKGGIANEVVLRGLQGCDLNVLIDRARAAAGSVSRSA
jgi:hypothetical protein